MEPEPLPPAEFPLSAQVTVGDLVEFYGIEVDAAAGCSLEELLLTRADETGLHVGASVQLGKVRLTVREISEGRVEWVGLEILP